VRLIRAPPGSTITVGGRRKTLENFFQWCHFMLSSMLGPLTLIDPGSTTEAERTYRPECPREQLEKEVKSLSSPSRATLTTLPLDFTHVEDHVSRFRHLCCFTWFDATVIDTSPQSNVGYGLPGRGGARSHTSKQD